MSNWKFNFESPNDSRIDEIISSTEQNVKEFTDNFDISDTSIENLKKLLDFNPEKDIIDVYIYLKCLSDIDKTNSDATKRYMHVISKWSDIFKPMNIFSDYYKSIGQEKLLEYSEILTEYKNCLIESANNLKYDIYDISIKNFLSDYNQVFNPINDLHSDYRQSFKYVFLNEEMSSSELSKYAENDDEKIRKAAFKVRNDVYTRPEVKTVLGAQYSLVCKQNVFNVKQKGLDNVTHPRALSEDISSDLIPSIISNVKRNYHLYHRFLQIQAKLMGKEKVDIHDLAYNPIKDNNDRHVTFDEGYDIYLNIISDFDEEFADISVDLFNNNKIDVYPSLNKRSGAYCMSHKHSDIYVLLNWTDLYSDISTLAHELGHAIHAKLTQKQNHVNADYPLCFAETASIMNETIMMNSIEVSDRLIYEHIQDMFGTIFRQIMYISFEYKAHTAWLNGETLTHEDYTKIWKEETLELYGDKVEFGEYDFSDWTRIPHIYNSPFYCYSYSFGNMLALSLYNMYDISEDREEFIEKYKLFLSSGTSDTPKNLLYNIFGIDYTENTMYDNAFQYISNLLDKLQ